jgi:hypothetical protein
LAHRNPRGSIVSDRRKTTGGPSERVAEATGWFARLADCLDRGRYADADVARKELNELGFLVTLRFPRQRHRPRPGKGVTDAR